MARLKDWRISAIIADEVARSQTLAAEAFTTCGSKNCGDSSWGLATPRVRGYHAAPYENERTRRA
ncbi:MAG TPA: hypothetical protein VMK12_12805 [Anaeromyxobacteraceae bacterium]|nr:hypothetical protein [Anaeromyxobacteraceae bacterium]